MLAVKKIKHKSMEIPCTNLFPFWIKSRFIPKSPYVLFSNPNAFWGCKKPYSMTEEISKKHMTATICCLSK